MDLGILYFFYDIYVSKYLLGPQSGILIEVILKIIFRHRCQRDFLGKKLNLALFMIFYF
jgi:hypothetical protein